jgi:hypothetical protein
MDALDAIHDCVDAQAMTCAVYRDTDDGPYDDDLTQVDTVDVAFSSPSAQSQVVIEGSFEETSVVGHIVPAYDTDGALVQSVHVNDELRVSDTQRYRVETKVGVPNEVEPELWELGLQRANATR